MAHFLRLFWLPGPYCITSKPKECIELLCIVHTMYMYTTYYVKYIYIYMYILCSYVNTYIYICVHLFISKGSPSSLVRPKELARLRLLAGSPCTGKRAWALNLQTRASAFANKDPSLEYIYIYPRRILIWYIYTYVLTYSYIVYSVWWFMEGFKGPGGLVSSCKWGHK